MPVKKKIFHTDLLIQVADINYGGHLGNDRFLTLAQEVRVRWLRSLEWSELDIGHSGAGFLVTEAYIKFHNEAFLGELLKASLYIEDISKCSCRLICELSEGDKPVGTIDTKLAFFDYQKRKIAKTPTALVDLVENLDE